MIFGAFLAIFILLAAVKNVPVEITRADEAALRGRLGLDPDTMAPHGFDDEIRLVRLVQDRVLTEAPGGDGIPEFEAREPQDLMRLRSGLCYDRSRSIEKALSFLGFKTRHVYLLYGAGRSFLSALLRYRQPSHAVSEVLTSRGWLVIDSNSRWVSLTESSQPIGAAQIVRRSGEFSAIPEYFKTPFWAIPGLYSRKGFFYRPYLPFPDINWPDLIEYVFGASPSSQTSVRHPV